MTAGMASVGSQETLEAPQRNVPCAQSAWEPCTQDPLCTVPEEVCVVMLSKGDRVPAILLHLLW
jgi:hypothetical protein